MKTTNLTLKDYKDKSFQSDFIDLYNEATEDYEFWSKDFNMHFGYYIPFKKKIFAERFYVE